MKKIIDNLYDIENKVEWEYKSKRIPFDKYHSLIHLIKDTIEMVKNIKTEK